MLPSIQGYTAIKELGRGGFGVVILARSAEDGRDVAIKMLHQSPALGDEHRRFIREARLLFAEVKNRHVVDLLDAKFDIPLPYLVLEYCQYGSLQSWVGKRREWRDVAAALAHVVQSLAGIHQANGFHRDVKPANLLLADGEDNELIVKPGDFGLARNPAVTGSLTRTFWGTEGYVAPEVVGGSDYTCSADIYSLGITGIELLTGRRGVDALGKADCPNALKTLLTRMTSTGASSRPNIEEIATELKDIVDEFTVGATEPDPENAPLATIGQLLIGATVVIGLGLLGAGAYKLWSKEVSGQ